ncbi:MAG: V-type ATP synthase subunit D [Spirochaetales bacterium]|nr:V-type ATP synthase subunit D [Spirochaetales bacterium]MCF7939909.1 V-type ATP synthase subunit D [Spirochaetales bacterium]
MAQVRLTKNELKQQKDALKRFQRYLPTLMLKKQQLQIVIRQVEAKEQEKGAQLEKVRSKLADWIAVFGEDQKLEEIVEVKKIVTGEGNIAGVDIPVFEDIDVAITPYDLFKKPPWVDKAVVQLKELIALDAEIKVLREQVRLLNEELRITSQRVNLFEKVKIPEAKENIRMINIFLGDQQTAAVVRGKIAKRKITRVS